MASVRGVGLCLIGLAATAALEGRPETALQIAAAAERYAEQEGIVNVYSNTSPGVFASTVQRRAPSRPAGGAIELGRTLTVKQALELARWS